MKTTIAACLLLASLQSHAQPHYYVAGDVIANEVSVTDSDGGAHTLRDLLGEHTSRVNVVFIFGGGDMGYGNPGHLWCPDSFEDTHILRTLFGKYSDKAVDFIAVASAPVYHSQTLGQQAGVFLNTADGSEEFVAATRAFVDSTLQSQTDGILPLAPYYDLRLKLSLQHRENMMPGEAFGPVEAWHGAFRRENDDQFYGVPSFWLVSDTGEILGQPFRGNIYHPHGADVRINYTFSEIDAAISALLDAESD